VTVSPQPQQWRNLLDKPRRMVVDGPLTRAAMNAAKRVGSLRHGRAFHPAGCTFEAEFDLVRPGPIGDALSAGEYRAQARLSKAASTPGRFPDVLGLAFRVHDVGDTPLDVALATAGKRPVARHVLMPSRSFTRAFYSSLLLYRAGERHVVIGAEAEPGTPDVPADVGAVARAVPVTFRIAVAQLRGPWVEVGLLTLTVATGADPHFDVVRNSVPGLQPVGWLNRLRGPVYRASQRGRDHASETS
jgi:hypothetical protein